MGASPSSGGSVATCATERETYETTPTQTVAKNVLAASSQPCLRVFVAGLEPSCQRGRQDIYLLSPHGMDFPFMFAILGSKGARASAEEVGSCMPFSLQIQVLALTIEDTSYFEMERHIT